MTILSLILLIATVSFASLAFILVDNFAATAVDDDNDNKKISNGEQECYGDHYKENVQIIIQRELGTKSIGDFDIAIKDGQVCIYMNDNVDERKSGISQPAPMQDNKNYCNHSTCVQFRQGEGDNEIGDVNINVS